MKLWNDEAMKTNSCMHRMYKEIRAEREQMKMETEAHFGRLKSIPVTCGRNRDTAYADLLSGIPSNILSARQSRDMSTNHSIASRL